MAVANPILRRMALDVARTRARLAARRAAWLRGRAARRARYERASRRASEAWGRLFDKVFDGQANLLLVVTQVRDLLAQAVKGQVHAIKQGSKRGLQAMEIGLRGGPAARLRGQRGHVATSMAHGAAGADYTGACTRRRTAGPLQASQRSGARAKKQARKGGR